MDLAVAGYDATQGQRIIFEHGWDRVIIAPLLSKVLVIFIFYV